MSKERVDYGKQIVSGLAKDLAQKYGRSFSLRNLRRMIQFSEVFPDFEIVSTLSTQLGWSHFLEVISITEKGYENKLHRLLKSARERIEQRKLLG